MNEVIELTVQYGRFEVYAVSRDNGSRRFLSSSESLARALDMAQVNYGRPLTLLLQPAQ